MVSKVQSSEVVFYPESDGRLMADNTRQFRWIVVIKENLEWLFADRSDVFVAGDLLWYPVEGNNKICSAPDAMVVFGRPKGESPEATLCDRGSYRQWEEDNLPPQVVFEILFPSNTEREMEQKRLFYERYGVEEYYRYDPDRNDLQGYQRVDNVLAPINFTRNWVSPLLKIRFEITEDNLSVYRPDGEPFLTQTEIGERLAAEQQRGEAERQRAEAERQRAEQAEAQLKQQQQRIAELEARLKAAGLNPEDSQ